MNDNENVDVNKENETEGFEGENNENVNTGDEATAPVTDGVDTPVEEEGFDVPVEGDEGAEIGSIDGADGMMMGDGMVMGDGMYAGIDGGAGATVKDPIMSSLPFVIGITSASLVVSIVLGILLAKKRIKKGIELYED